MDQAVPQSPDQTFFSTLTEASAPKTYTEIEKNIQKTYKTLKKTVSKASIKRSIEKYSLFETYEKILDIVFTQQDDINLCFGTQESLTETYKLLAKKLDAIFNKTLNRFINEMYSYLDEDLGISEDTLDEITNSNDILVQLRDYIRFFQSESLSCMAESTCIAEKIENWLAFERMYSFQEEQDFVTLKIDMLTSSLDQLNNELNRYDTCKAFSPPMPQSKRSKYSRRSQSFSTNLHSIPEENKQPGLRLMRHYTT